MWRVPQARGGGSWASRRGKSEHASWFCASPLTSPTLTQRAHNCPSTAFPTAMTMSSINELSLPLPSLSPAAPHQLSEDYVYLLLVTAKGTGHYPVPCKRPKSWKEAHKMHSLKERKPQLRGTESGRPASFPRILFSGRCDFKAWKGKKTSYPEQHPSTIPTSHKPTSPRAVAPRAQLWWREGQSSAKGPADNAVTWTKKSLI